MVKKNMSRGYSFIAIAVMLVTRDKCIFICKMLFIDKIRTITENVISDNDQTCFLYLHLNNLRANFNRTADIFRKVAHSTLHIPCQTIRTMSNEPLATGTFQESVAVT